jgi:predicted nucleic acid-binding protein
MWDRPSPYADTGLTGSPFANSLLRPTSPAASFDVGPPAMDEIPVDRRVANRAGLLRRQLPALRMPDALIAASALVHGIALATRNQRDFKRVPGLRLRRSS